MYLVTGGAGYLGSCIASRLLSRGERVRVFDIQETKYVPQGAEMMQADMRDDAACREAARGVDIVIHTAFVQSFSKLDEATQRAIDLDGTRNFLEAAAESGVKRFVHASTIEIYGTHPPYPCPEEAPIDPVGLYGRLKWECELLVRDFCARTPLPVAMMRMPTICGPGFYNHKPLLDFLDRILDGKAVAVVGDGSLVGDFVHVDDVVDAFLLAADKEAAACEAFNVSCEVTATHRQMLEAAIAAAESHSRILSVPHALAPPLLLAIRLTGLSGLPKEQVGYLLHHNRYSIEKAKRLLGFSPRYSAAEAMAALISGYRADRAFVKARSC